MTTLLVPAAAAAAAADPADTAAAAAAAADTADAAPAPGTAAATAAAAVTPGHDGLRGDLLNGHPYPQSVHNLHPAQPHLPSLATPSSSSSSTNSCCNGDPTPTAAILTFSEVPNNLARLTLDSPHATVKPPPVAPNHTPSPSPLSSSSSSQPSGRRAGLTLSIHSDLANSIHPTQPIQLVTSPISPPLSSSHPLLNPRKPSPGLAARLKALGFGNAHKNQPLSPLHHIDNVGRLPEDQLRRLDQKHQAGSVVPVIERRGRPWKGAGAVVARFPLSSGRRKHGLGHHTHDDHLVDHSSVEHDEAVESVAVVAAVAAVEANEAHHRVSIVLPEIETASPLEMDTNKFRLPDHTNGNGTKAHPETLQLHLERDSCGSLPNSPDIPPPPPPKDTPPLSPQVGTRPSSLSALPAPAPATPSQSDFNADDVYFNPLGLQRAGSIYTLSRVSFANQLAQLTSLQLPDAESLSSKVSAIPTAQAASRALIGAAEQIRNWIAKASEVVSGLDSDDDVEWAAAGGREGLEEVENAILRFEELINVYVDAIEELQCRSDIATVHAEDLQRAVYQMESILSEWGKMRKTLQSVKAQVEIAMEWEELWSMVLGDIQNEMEELSRLVFEMEERRHKSMMAGESAGVDIGDLETIVEETQQQQKQEPPNSAPTRVPATSGSNRYSIPIFPTSPSSPEEASGGAASPGISQDDSSLLALFARMQPLRASLDFLPMRLAGFEARAADCFPAACEELESRRMGLDSSYRKLEKDAESLRKELGEDRWITVFRGAARQAQKMYESVERSVGKLHEALDTGLYLTNQPLMAKKTESYETKKMHYGPAIERVLAIIDKGIKDRLTLNGEILRLHAELQSKWDELHDRMHDVDLGLEEVHVDQTSQQLRDSISSMLSNDHSSTLDSGHETPQSSPPSSVIMSSLGLEGGKADNCGNKSSATGKNNASKRRSVYSSLSQAPPRRSSSALGTTAPVHKPLPMRFSMSSTGPAPSPSIYLSTSSGTSTPRRSHGREGSITPVGKRASSRPPDHRPRWNSSTNGIDTGHNFKPLTLTTPSPYAKTPPPPARRTPGSASSGPSRLPMRSPLSRSASRAATASPMPMEEGMGSATGSPSAPVSNRRVSMQSAMAATNNLNASTSPRPSSSLAGSLSSRRISLLPGMRPKRDSTASPTGRDSPGFSMRGSFRKGTPSDGKADSRPRWRP